jgi:hypothetical protein
MLAKAIMHSAERQVGWLQRRTRVTVALLLGRGFALIFAMIKAMHRLF